MPLCFALTVFLVSAFLVFQVQPVISKCILPWFGGSPAVWTTCMLFFQLVLFAGYGYAHAAARLRPATQGIVHLGLIALALVLLPITPSEAWKPLDAYHPTWRILALLAANVGVPSLLSSTGPLIQSWFAQTQPGRSPYRLYALSNVGSLAALVSYPFVVEPLLATSQQGRWWSVGFAAFALLCGYAAWNIWRLRHSATNSTVQERSTADANEAPPTLGRRLHWLALATLPSIMLLATTNHVCQDVAVLPLLWVLPLALYLISFIVCFEKEHWYRGEWFGPLACASIVGASAIMLARSLLPLWVEVSIYFTALFMLCMLCHGELVRRKPSPRYLTSFYLMTAAGGALGGLLVTLVAPVVFSSYYELNLSLLIGYGLALATTISAWPRGPLAIDARWGRLAAAAAFVGLLFVVRGQASAVVTQALCVSRDFYGILGISELYAEEPNEHRRIMRHGRILHGSQYMAPQRRMEPMSYFSESSGVGRTLNKLRRQRETLRVGVVGLGVGTLAAYGRAGDEYRFYEINPEVERLAREYFTFLSDSPAKVDVVLGDARLCLERERPQAFDLLVLDAFSGDAIPAHLLTREALAMYLGHVRSDGVLAVHISNRHVDLRPVLHAVGLSHDLRVGFVENDQDPSSKRGEVSRWALLVRRESVGVADEFLRDADERAPARSILWTDDRSNVFEILN